MSSRPTALARSLTIMLQLLAVMVAVVAGGNPSPAADGKAVHHLVVLGDPHLPGPNLAQKEAVLKTINAWNDVDMVIAVGDICAEYGTEAEYAAAASYFSKLRHPLVPVAGNHDYIFATPDWPGGGYNTGSRAIQEAKLQTFRTTFGLDRHFYSKEVGNYFLILLSTDHDRFATGLSEPQLAWLASELARHRHLPTIIVFHGPLIGTQYNFRRYINRPHAVAQPIEAIHALITANPQVFLWVPGHTHTPPTEASFAAAINVYAGQVTNIHNADMRGATLWTNSLWLYPDRVEIKTYNHQTNTWLPALDRTIMPPRP